jgi:Uma2 family endonuclease
MTAAHSVRRLTEAEYLALERRAEGKSEFLDGEMFAMSGGSSSHSLIQCNLIRELGTRLKGSPCVLYSSDMRVKVQAVGLYTYPDVSVACDPIQFEDEHDDTLLNPVVIVEVLSDSSEAYDRGKKFEFYRQLPSLREYVLAHQHQPRIEQYIRQTGGGWLLREVAGLESKLSLASVGVTTKMSEVYYNLQFPPAGQPRKPSRPRAKG